MSDDTKRSARGYRVPKIDIKRLILSIVTLGFKRQKHTNEEAKTYVYVFEDTGIRINESELQGGSKAVAFKSVSSAEERERIISKGKFEEGSYIYYLDRETIS